MQYIIREQEIAMRHQAQVAQMEMQRLATSPAPYLLTDACITDRTRYKYKVKPTTFREKLQIEINEWLKGVKIGI